MSKLLVITFFLLSIGQAFAKTHHVTIKKFRFVPSTIDVQQGDTIHFMNEDPQTHSVIPTPDSKFQFDESDDMSMDATFSLEVDTDESFEAQCGVHLSMPGIQVNVLSEELVLINEIRTRLDLLEKLNQ